MTRLQRQALARTPLPPNVVERIYGKGYTVNDVHALCESHERLRAEVEGAMAILAETEARLAMLERKVAHGCAGAKCKRCDGGSK